MVLPQTNRSHKTARTHSRTWLRVRAVLAGGLVLGVGATLTLASWNDSEYASGTLKTSTFDLQSSPTNISGNFSSHPEGAPLVLDFAPSNMAPGSLRQKQFFIRNTGTVAGTYTFSAPDMAADDSSFPLKSHLKYRAIETTGSCTATSFTSGTPQYLAGGSSSWVAIGTPASAPRNLAAGGTAVGICVELQLSATTPNDRQGKTVAVQIMTTATSETP